MSRDLALIWTGRVWDLAPSGASLAPDDGLATAVILSLFSDARALPDDPVPAGLDRRGWWADALPPAVAGRAAEGDRFGSRLWLLAREKQTDATRTRALAYVRDALAWLVEDGVATRVVVSGEWARRGALAVEIVIERGDAPAWRGAWNVLWDALEGSSNGVLRALA